MTRGISRCEFLETENFLQFPSCSKIHVMGICGNKNGSCHLCSNLSLSDISINTGFIARTQIIVNFISDETKTKCYFIILC